MGKIPRTLRRNYPKKFRENSYYPPLIVEYIYIYIYIYIHIKFSISSKRLHPSKYNILPLLLHQAFSIKKKKKKKKE